VERVCSPIDLMDGQLFGDGGVKSQVQTTRPCIECSLLEFGGMPILAGRTTPIDAWEQGAGAFSVTMCFSGGPRYQEGSSSLAVAPGDVLLLPRTGGCISTGYLSSVNFPIEHGRLERTLRAMQVGQFRPQRDRPHLLSGDAKGRVAGHAALLFGYLRFVDQLLAESRHLGSLLGLDEQLYRLMALSLLRASPGFDAVQRHWSSWRSRWGASLDDLVDYIRCNAHAPLTLTDLEVQSNYSARHLQTLFRERFACTPMQFVRQQRLTLAMQRLQSAQPGDTVTLIARSCGYRYTSNFSCDFRREFGVTASSVLRASRGAGRDHLSARMLT
jgi:AraC-like DNA-binding protein